MATVHYFLLGGGGAGGQSNAAGGGAGGWLEGSDTLTSGSLFVDIGEGGASASANGNPTTYNGHQADGGGGGAGGGSGSGNSGGCGGGACTSGSGGTGSQGGNGGAFGSGDVDSMGGGGGHGGAGGAGVGDAAGGNGGAGAASPVPGDGNTYAGGGGGQGAVTDGTGTDGGGNAGSTGGSGAANFGCGGGAGQSTAGAGGSGRAAVWYTTGAFSSASGGTITTSGGFTIHTFTSDGTFVFTTVVAYTLNLSPGSYTVTGASALLSRAKPDFNLSPGSYAVTGAPLLENRGVTMPVAPGSYAVTGAPLVIGVAKTMNLSPGSYNVNGSALEVDTYLRGAWVVVINGIERGVRLDGTGSIRRVLKVPTTATFNLDGTAPTGGDYVTIRISGNPYYVFRGSITNITQVFDGDQVNSPVWQVTCSSASLLNRRMPFGEFVNTSATTVAQWLITNFTTGFTSVNVQASLPLVTVTYDGMTDVFTALKNLATKSGSLFYFDYQDDLHFYQTESPLQTPDPLDNNTTTLQLLPPIARARDLTQLANRVRVLGANATLLSNVNASETILPIDNAALFSGSGSVSINTLAVSFTGVVTGGGGALVGAGATPASPVSVALQAGSGLSSGVYNYAYTDTTAAGESLPSPLATVTTGTLAGPVGPLSTNFGSSPFGGNGPDPGAHGYAVSFKDSTGGETVPTAVTGTITTSADLGAPAAGSDLGIDGQFLSAHGIGPGTRVYVAFSSITFNEFGNPSTESALGPSFSHVTLATGYGDGSCFGFRVSSPNGSNSDGFAAYISTDQVTWYNVGSMGSNYPFWIQGSYIPGTYPTFSTPARRRCVQLLSLPLDPSGLAVSREVYRTTAGGSQLKHVDSVADNTTTSYTDHVTDASLGANAPVTNTTNIHQVNVASIAPGATGTTGRKLYRTAHDSSQLKLLHTFADNTTLVFADSTADGSLGANAPTSDTSGLTLAPGQVTAGAVSMLTTGSGAFRAGGGWVIVGNQVIRYTGFTNNMLTGIPVSGAGAVLQTIAYGATISAASLLTGVSGLTLSALLGDLVYILAQVDDLTAQTILGLMELDKNGNPTDGIHEATIIDTTQTTAAACTALAAAKVALYKLPIDVYKFVSSDPKIDIGRLIHLNLTPEGYTGDVMIQDVTIPLLDVVSQYPLQSVVAASVWQTVEDLLLRI